MDGMQEKDKAPHPVAVAMAAYLSNWLAVPHPISAVTEGVTLKTTEAIIRDLDDMVDATPQDVAALMIQAGYSMVYLPNGRHGWVMRPKTGDSNQPLATNN